MARYIMHNIKTIVFCCLVMLSTTTLGAENKEKPQDPLAEVELKNKIGSECFSQMWDMVLFFGCLFGTVCVLNGVSMIAPFFIKNVKEFG